MLTALALAALTPPPAHPALPRSIARACPGRSVPRRPCADLRPGFEQAGNYPREALVWGEEGIAHYRVKIGRNGRVTRCEITRTSHSRSLDKATCRILAERIAYDPARDAHG